MTNSTFAAHTNLNIRKNSNSDTYTAYTGRNTLVKDLTLYGGVWKVTANDSSVDYYENKQGQVVYILTEQASDTKKGFYFETAEMELLFLQQFDKCINNYVKMVELIRIIKEF
tara:strand:+ start:150 stop:488 length:339 start_codon:yes stop_codon:yes gene_type:complete